MSKEQGAEYYDSAYKESTHYAGHYSKSRYYELWKKVLSHIPEGAKVFDVGCGPGQFGKMAIDENKVDYYGIDISGVAVEMANKVMGENRCSVGSGYDCPIPTDSIIVCLETLEHIDDYKFLSRVPKGMQIILTVPSFDDPAHVRYFKTLNAVLLRYIDKIRLDHAERHLKWYLLKGIVV